MFKKQGLLSTHLFHLAIILPQYKLRSFIDITQSLAAMSLPISSYVNTTSICCIWAGNSLYVKFFTWWFTLIIQTINNLHQSSCLTAVTKVWSLWSENSWVENKIAPPLSIWWYDDTLVFTQGFDTFLLLNCEVKRSYFCTGAGHVYLYLDLFSFRLCQFNCNRCVWGSDEVHYGKLLWW